MAEKNTLTTDVASAVKTIKTAILQSQEHAVKAVNQEQLALYYGIVRFISVNTRNKNWGKGVIVREGSKDSFLTLCILFANQPENDKSYSRQGTI